MMRWLTLVLLTTSCVHLTGSSPEGALAGQLVDGTGTPLTGIEVHIRELEQQDRQVLRTDEAGRFELQYLLNGVGERVPLRRGQRLRLSAWRPGLVPRQIELSFPGGRTVLAPLIVEVERLELRPAPLQGFGGEELEAPIPAGANRSGRGE